MVTALSPVPGKRTCVSSYWPSTSINMSGHPAVAFPLKRYHIQVDSCAVGGLHLGLLTPPSSFSAAFPRHPLCSTELWGLSRPPCTQGHGRAQHPASWGVMLVPAGPPTGHHAEGNISGSRSSGSRSLGNLGGTILPWRGPLWAVQSLYHRRVLVRCPQVHLPGPERKYMWRAGPLYSETGGQS